MPEEALLSDSSEFESIPEEKPFNWRHYASFIPTSILYFVILGLYGNVVAVFASLFVGILTGPFSLSIMVYMALLLLSFSVPFSDIAHGYSNETVWLVWSAFHLSTSIRKHLSDHVTIPLLHRYCRGWLSLSYCLISMEIVTAMVIPSNTARAGMILPVIFSIVDRLHHSFEPYLCLLGAFSNLIASSLWMYGMAANPLIVDMMQSYTTVNFDFLDWCLGAMLPTIFICALLPFVLRYHINIDTQQVVLIRHQIATDYARLPPLQKRQYGLLAILGTCVVLFVTHHWHMIPSVLITMTGVLLLVMGDILTWTEIVGNSQAWDAFFWLGGFVSIVHVLEMKHITDRIGDMVSELLPFSPILATWCIGLLYYFSMYLFSGTSSHMMALASPLLMSGVQLGSPPKMLLAMLAYFTTLGGLLTHYSSGSTVMYYSKGAVSASQWLKVGCQMSVVVLMVYTSVGMVWWKLLGFY